MTGKAMKRPAARGAKRAAPESDAEEAPPVVEAPPVSPEPPEPPEPPREVRERDRGLVIGRAKVQKPLPDFEPEPRQKCHREIQVMFNCTDRETGFNRSITARRDEDLPTLRRRMTELQARARESLTYQEVVTALRVLRREFARSRGGLIENIRKAQERTQRGAQKVARKVAPELVEEAAPEDEAAPAEDEAAPVEDEAAAGGDEVAVVSLCVPSFQLVGA
ncbi:unnamed protein product [Effrenium voratum]|nr:unnamed protein product [Effrenium voratum]